MSNKCDFGVHRRPTGWIAWYRLHHHGANRVLRDGRNDIIFASEAEADAAAKALAKSRLAKLFRTTTTTDAENKERAA